MTSSNNIAIAANHLSKHYEDGVNRIDVLINVSLSIPRGEMVAILGASGSGKSTLLHILGLLDTPNSGEISIDGIVATDLSETERSRLRNRSLGFVYQFHHLLPEFSALDNVAMPLIVRRIDRQEAREAAKTVLEQVGLVSRMAHFPGQLSGGERQRVALARALVTKPACILADEPTGNLDRHTAVQMFDLLKQVNRDSGTALVIVTHDHELASLADRKLFVSNGQLA